MTTPTREGEQHGQRPDDSNGEKEVKKTPRTRTRRTTEPKAQTAPLDIEQLVAAAAEEPTIVQPSTNGDTATPLPKASVGQISAAKAPIEFDRWLWRNFLPEGAFVVMAGAGGVGKSSLIAHIVSGVSNGTLEGNFYGKPQNCIWYSREDSTTVSLKGKLVAGEANQDRIVLMDQNGEKGSTTLTLPADLEKLGQDIVDNHYKVVVLDLLMSFVETRRSLHQNYGNVIQVFSRIAEMCASKKVTVIGIMHNKNGSREASPDSVVSSIGIPGVARQVLMVGNLGDTGLKVMGVVKSNVAPTMTGYVYAVDYVPVARDPQTGEPKLASQIRLIRPAERHEVAACLEKSKLQAGFATSQIKVILRALEDGEEKATKATLYPLVAEELGVKMRRFQELVAQAISIGVLDSRVTGGGGDRSTW